MNWHANGMALILFGIELGKFFKFQLFLQIATFESFDRKFAVTVVVTVYLRVKLRLYYRLSSDLQTIVTSH